MWGKRANEFVRCFFFSLSSTLFLAPVSAEDGGLDGVPALAAHLGGEGAQPHQGHQVPVVQPHRLGEGHL